MNKPKPVYRKFYLPEHPLADMLGFVARHKIVMYELLGQALQPGEVIHHKDFDKSNDGEENLQVMLRIEHQRIPELQARFLISRNLLREFFEWWQIHKNDEPTEEYKIRHLIIKAQNEQEMIKRKMTRCSK